METNSKTIEPLMSAVELKANIQNNKGDVNQLAEQLVSRGCSEDVSVETAQELIDIYNCTLAPECIFMNVMNDALVNVTTWLQENNKFTK